MADDFTDLDEALTAANLKRARTRSDFAQHPTQRTADADTEAWEATARIGELYLEARFEHEAREAGLFVDPSVFELDVEEDAVGQELRQVREELSVYDAITRALEDPHRALDAILGAEDRPGAQETLRATYGLDATQADAVVENLSRLATATDRSRLEQRRRELLDRLHHLESRSKAP